MEIQFKDTSGTISVADEVFSVDYNEPLVHQVVVSFLSTSRSGTKAQKTRSEVSGGGSKPWKQKGTGRARAGTIRSPIWRTGGVAFAAKPCDYSKKINRKMYRASLRSIFSELNRVGRLAIVERVSIAAPKTKNMMMWLRNLGFDSDVLIVVPEVYPELYLSARNLPRVTVVDVDGVNPILLLRHKAVVLDKGAVESINGQLS